MRLSYDEGRNGTAIGHGKERIMFYTYLLCRRLFLCLDRLPNPRSHLLPPIWT